jgi:hypothetical protein
MDFADISSDLNDLENEQLVNQARAKAMIKKFPYNGHCYNCEDPLEEPKVFCDSLCRDEYEEMKVKLARRCE